MKTNQKGFTTYEVLIVIGLISIILSASLYSINFLRDTQADKREFIEEQLNFGLIEYYGLFGKYPFQYDPVNSITIRPSEMNIKLEVDSFGFILEEIEKYVGYRVDDFETVEAFLEQYDVELIYRDLHVAQLDIKDKP